VLETVTIEKIVHGGQGLGTLPDGRKVFVWNALPGETVKVRLIKAKKSYAEGIAEEVIKASPSRIEPEEPNYLATSPWQIMTYAIENQFKSMIAHEVYLHEKVRVPASMLPGAAIHDEREWQYRNKMEYSFWGDDDGLHLALHQRGSHGKQIVTGSRLAMPAIDEAANAVCEVLNKLEIRAGNLKTIIVRCSQKAGAVGALFVKLEEFPKLELPPELAGLRVYYSDPRSPASVPTRLLYELGDSLLHDSLLGKDFVYDVDSFFQVNVPIFEKALQKIRRAFVSYAASLGNAGTAGLTDMYSGVGSIGLSVAADEDGVPLANVTLVELDPASVRMAGQNARSADATVIEASTEKALDYITSDQPVIFDPPRAGLHDKVTAKVLEATPPLVIYLSCNPATHARDLARLQEAYDITSLEVFNFFPRTPHIEALAVLRRRPDQ
jgi:23S rRNA (uracil1939-C5)-methyltransferase